VGAAVAELAVHALVARRAAAIDVGLHAVRDSIHAVGGRADTGQVAEAAHAVGVRETALTVRASGARPAAAVLACLAAVLGHVVAIRHLAGLGGVARTDHADAVAVD